ncbi:hypothetical protein CKO11_10250 [Rhodobacter sp. TJ_12]|uniref:hypothetical protein n=1 Tax=Rhodobacter sp. TJ_12 TaxID=2029399 RepID=UPI001CBB9212|nr:hypothetical protein [Rhodobacter sp. TJ_12]MBZ4022840.1 hypothetical protein [Rhodobacter sp. TJ_12]
MVQASEIKNEETLQAWLDARPEDTRQREAVTLAHRAAMRVLPIWISRQRVDWPGSNAVAGLSILQGLLVSGIPEVTEAQAALTIYGKMVVDRNGAALTMPRHWSANPRKQINLETFGDVAAQNAVRSANCAFSSVITHFPHEIEKHLATGISASVAAIGTAAAQWDVGISVSLSEFWDSIRNDLISIEERRAPLRSPLWERALGVNSNPLNRAQFTEKLPGWFFREWRAAAGWFRTHPGYEFWLRWYEAALAGRPLTGDWESHAQLLSDIALIPDEDWKQGAEHVAALIAEIEERYRLLAETRRLKGELAPVVAEISPAQIGHNNPPEALEEAVPAKPVLIIWETLDETERELETRRPSKPRLQQLAKVLLDASIEIARYCGQLGDKALQKAAEEVGSSSVKWAVRIGAGSFATKMLGLDDAVRTFAEALARYAGG